MYFIFSFKCGLFWWTKLLKNGPELVTRRSSGYETIPVLFMYFLTNFDDVIQSGLWVIAKITSANLCKPIHNKYSTSICPFESGKCGKEKKKLQNFEYLENEKSFFSEIKNIFYNFWRDIICWKNKNLIKKIADTFLTDWFQCKTNKP